MKSSEGTPESDLVQLSTRIPTEDLKALGYAAWVLGTSTAEQIRIAVSEHLTAQRNSPDFVAQEEEAVRKSRAVFFGEQLHQE